MNQRLYRTSIKNKDEVINALHQAMVSMTACMGSQRELLETLMEERTMHCATRCPVVELEVP